MANVNQNFKQQQQQQKKSFDTAQSAAQSTASAASAGFEKYKAQMDKLAQDATAHSRETAEALTKSGSIFATGLSEWTKTWSDLVQKSAERNGQALKTLLGARTLTEVSETHSRLAQENLDSFLNGVTQLSEIGVRITTEAFEPLNDHINSTVQRVKDAA